MDEKKIISMANSVINGRQAMSLNEIKILRLALTKIDRNDTEFKDISISKSEIIKAMGLSEKYKDFSKDLKETATKLFDRRLEIKNSRGGWSLYHWVRYIHYDSGVLIVRLDDMLKPFFLELKNRFTQVEIFHILRFKSMYSIRIYELLKCDFDRNNHKHNFTYTLEELRDITATNGKYTKISQFKERVLTSACAEINEKTNLSIKYAPIKENRKIIAFEFYIEVQNKLPELENKKENLDQSIMIKGMIEATGETCSIDNAERLSQKYGQNMALFAQNYGKAVSVQGIKNLAGYLYKMAENPPPVAQPEKKKGKPKLSPGEVQISEERKNAYIELDKLDEDWLWSQEAKNED